MTHPRTRGRRAWARALLLLWTLAVLAPGVSRAMSAWHGAAEPWQQVCAATGLAAAQADGQAGADRQTDAALAHALDHCALCALQQLDAAPPPAVAGWPAQVAGAPTVAMTTVVPPPATPSAWAPARAPPAL